MSELVNGKIPAHTVCPYRSQCAFANQKPTTCHHKGIEHKIAFSCSVARAYVMINKSPRVE